MRVPDSRACLWPLLVSALLVLDCARRTSALVRPKESLARIATAGDTTRPPDLLLLRDIGAFLPCEPVPKARLRRVGPDSVYGALERWEGRLGDWDVQLLQTTNDSQIGCVPWGSITAVSFSASRADAREAYDEWLSRMIAVFGRAPRRSSGQHAQWLRSWSADWWYAHLDAREAGHLRLEFVAAAFDIHPFVELEYAGDEGKARFLAERLAGDSRQRRAAEQGLAPDEGAPSESTRPRW
jgi:hypothetical protein